MQCSVHLISHIYNLRIDLAKFTPQTSPYWTIYIQHQPPILHAPCRPRTQKLSRGNQPLHKLIKKQNYFKYLKNQAPKKNTKHIDMYAKNIENDTQYIGL